MARCKTALVILSIVLALAAPLLMAAKAYNDQRAYPVVKVEIEPYDPRDLFYGHYLMFATKWNWDGGKVDPKGCTAHDCCLCLGAGDENPKASLVTCTPGKPPQCTHILKGAYYGDDRYNINIDRYYVDERVALPLEKLFRDKKKKFTAALSISPQGQAILGKLFVDGQFVNDYADQHWDELIALPDQPDTLTSEPDVPESSAP